MHFLKENCQPLEMLNCLASSIHQGISVIDAELNLVMINETALDLLDIPSEVIQEDQSLASVFRFNAERGDYGPGDSVAQVNERLELARKFLPHDFVRTRPDGTVLRIQGTPMDNGGFITVYTDITLQRQQEHALLVAQERLQTSLDARTEELEANRDMLLNAINVISDGLVIAGPDGKTTLANEKMYEIYPCLPELIKKGATVNDVIRSIFPDEPDRSIEELTQGDSTWTERKFPDGRWYKVAHCRTRDGGFLAVYTDITSYKKQHSMLQRHTDELVRHLRKEKELNEMQREFVSMASHEFRTPLAIIDSNAQRMLRRVDRLEKDSLVERLGNIRESVERMQYLINRFLNFSQSQSVGMDIEREPVSLRDLVARVCGRQQSLSKAYHFQIDVENLPDSLELDKKLIEQSISNLVSNAVKYSPEETTISVVGSIMDDYVVISVRDEGVGIPKEEIPKIFKRYFRASTSSGIAGTGIGLNMTRMIVQKHGGAMNVESEVGKGTTVTMSLPILQLKDQVKRAKAS